MYHRTKNKTLAIYSIPQIVYVSTICEHALSCKLRRVKNIKNYYTASSRNTCFLVIHSQILLTVKALSLFVGHISLAEASWSLISHLFTQQTENHHIQNTAHYYFLWVSSKPYFNNMCSVMSPFDLKLYLTVSVCLGCFHRPFSKYLFS